MSTNDFATLMCRVRAGDAEAATELVRQYEPEIRRILRLRLSDSRLGRLLDSSDICQSVWGRFFVGTAVGEFDLEQPEQLVKLLMTMVRNRLRDHARRQSAARRDQRRTELADTAVINNLADSVATPSKIVSGRELLDAARRRLNEEERDLAERRALGHGWAEIAAELGDGPEALRKKLARAIDRVSDELGL